MKRQIIKEVTVVNMLKNKFDKIKVGDTILFKKKRTSINKMNIYAYLYKTDENIGKIAYSEEDRVKATQLSSEIFEEVPKEFEGTVIRIPKENNQRNSIIVVAISCLAEEKKIQKTEIQKALYQIISADMKGKEYSEKMKMISDMQEYLECIKNSLRADATLVTCNHCNKKSKASEWNTEEKILNYEKNLNSDYNEDDKWIKIISIGTYGICPICGGKKLIKEDIKEEISLRKGF